MEENIDTKVIDNNEINEENQLLAENKMHSQMIEMVNSEHEREKKEAEELHKEKMKDIYYRREYYQNKIDTFSKMIPRERYYKEEYEALMEKIDRAYNKINDLEDEKDMEKVVLSVRQMAKKTMNAGIVFGILMGIIMVAFAIFVIILIIEGKKL